MRIAMDTPRRRRLNLTPMIDVVLLLLVFFMMVSRFGGTQGITLALGQGAGAWSGPPRLVEVAADAITLNGIAVTDLAASLAPLMASPDDTIVLRARLGAPVQAVVAALTALRAAGLTRIVLVE